ncbi:MAG: FAD-dependent oxidoreductase [Rubricoccaceae bacterium]
MHELANRADVAVIGAGAVGLCAARALQRRGREVTVLTREPVGIGASAGNAGMVTPSHFVPLSSPGVIGQGLRWMLNPASPFHIRPRLNADLVRWLWLFRKHCTEAHVQRSMPVLRDLALASVDLMEALQDDVGDIGYAQTGLLMAYRTEKGRKADLELADRAEAMGLGVERLDAAALAEREPTFSSDLLGAVLHKQDGRVDPDALLRQLEAALTRDGARVHSGLDVHTLDPQPDGTTRLHTSNGEIQAETVVLAAGSWTSQLTASLGLRLPLQPAKGYSLTTEAPADAPTLPTIFTDDKVTVTPLPSSGRLRFTGTLALTGFDPSVDERRAAPIRQLAARYAPEAADLEMWSGYRPCSPDGLPYIGPVLGHNSVLVATGHGMMGLMLAPVSGELVAELAMGEPTTVDASPFRPDRFWRSTLWNLGV